MSVKQFHSKKALLPGSSYSEVVARARKEFNTVRKLTKRQPYVRSKYFRGDKIFMTVFWDHVMQKHRKDRTNRLRFYSGHEKPLVQTCGVLLFRSGQTGIWPERSLKETH